MYREQQSGQLVLHGGNLPCSAVLPLRPGNGSVDRRVLEGKGENAGLSGTLALGL
jgi:hypothetical protein